MLLSPSFCPVCSGALAELFLPDEGRNRLVCSQCGYIYYLNPHVVSGTVPVADGRIWLLRRAIEPRYGAWTFPAGYMEMGESVEEAAIRETREELNLEIRLGPLLGVYSRSDMTTVLVVYRADAVSEPTGGAETLEFAAFTPEEIPWRELAFWTTERALRDWTNSLP
jgi:ADP-ribose pyrophosphatase YjhB (NUDIX family)